MKNKKKEVNNISKNLGKVSIFVIFFVLIFILLIIILTLNLNNFKVNSKKDYENNNYLASFFDKINVIKWLFNFLFKKSNSSYGSEESNLKPYGDECQILTEQTGVEYSEENCYKYSFLVILLSLLNDDTEPPFLDLGYNYEDFNDKTDTNSIGELYSLNKPSYGKNCTTDKDCADDEVCIETNNIDMIIKNDSYYEIKIPKGKSWKSNLDYVEQNVKNHRVLHLMKVVRASGDFLSFEKNNKFTFIGNESKIFIYPDPITSYFNYLDRPNNLSEVEEKIKFAFLANQDGVLVFDVIAEAFVDKKFYKEASFKIILNITIKESIKRCVKKEANITIPVNLTYIDKKCCEDKCKECNTGYQGEKCIDVSKNALDIRDTQKFLDELRKDLNNTVIEVEIFLGMTTKVTLLKGISIKYPNVYRNYLAQDAKPDIPGLINAFREESEKEILNEIKKRRVPRSQVYSFAKNYIIVKETEFANDHPHLYNKYKCIFSRSPEERDKFLKDLVEKYNSYIK
ncbi:MAG: hypothetical protein QXW97_01365 [Candidatus Pacearchaeota archaeon]